MVCTSQDLYHAAAAASVTALLDRVPGEGHWDDWLSGRFTKSVRRVRSAAAWDRLSDRWYVASHGPASVVALPPMPYSGFPADASRAQVQGVLLPEGYNPPREGLMVLVDGGLAMSAGKAAAQAAHALMQRALVEEWTGLPAFSVHVVSGSDLGHHWSEEFGITDSGLTELPGPTRTATTIRRPAIVS